jgi:hypothetical protein
MPDWAMDPEPLYDTGGDLSRLETVASAAGRGFLASVTDAGASVHHPIIRAALDGYHGTWSPSANRLSRDVVAAGAQTQGAAVAGVLGDQQAADDQRPALSSQLHPLGSVARSPTAVTSPMSE